MSCCGRGLSLGLCVAAFVLLTACGSVPEVRYFTLGGPDGAPSGDSDGSTLQHGLWLGVEELVADPPYDQDRLVFRQADQPAEVGFYEFTRWAAPLGQLVQGHLVRVLHGQPGIRLAEPASSGRPYDLVLRGRILQAEEVDAADGSLVARLRLSLQFVDSEGALVWNGEVLGEASGRAEDGEGVMALMRQATARALAGVERQVALQLAE